MIFALIVTFLLFTGTRFQLGSFSVCGTEIGLFIFTAHFLWKRNLQNLDLSVLELFIFFLLLAISLLSAAISPGHHYVNYLSDVRNFLFPLVFFLIVHRHLTFDEAHPYIISIISVGTALAIYGILQATIMPLLPLEQNAQTTEFFQYKSSFVRNSFESTFKIIRFPIAFCDNPHDFTANLIFPSSLALLFAVFNPHKHKIGIFYIISFVITFFCILIGLQRSAALTTIGSLIFYVFFFLQNNLLRLIVIILCGLCLPLISIFDWDGGGTLNGRFEANLAFIDFSIEKPQRLFLGGEKFLFAEKNLMLPHMFPLYLCLTFGIFGGIIATAFILFLLLKKIQPECNTFSFNNNAIHSTCLSVLFIYAMQTSFFDVATNAGMFFFVLTLAFSKKSTKLTQGQYHAS